MSGVNVCEQHDIERVDPRIQGELEALNNATDEINRLETEVDVANASFRNTLSESSQQLKILAKKVGKSIEKARPYYEAREVALKAHREAQEAAIKYQRANGIHRAAKETIFVAEQRLLNMADKREFDTAWQQMINHATQKLNEAEFAKIVNEREHMTKSAIFVEAEHRLQKLEKDLRAAINKSRPYFEKKELFDNLLWRQKRSLQEKCGKVQAAKRRYADALNNLEQISEEIHEQRLARKLREPGVGADEIEEVELPSPSHDEILAMKERAKSFREDPKALSNCDLDNLSLSLSSLPTTDSNEHFENLEDGGAEATPTEGACALDDPCSTEVTLVKTSPFYVGSVETVNELDDRCELSEPSTCDESNQIVNTDTAGEPSFFNRLRSQTVAAVQDLPILSSSNQRRATIIGSENLEETQKTEKGQSLSSAIVLNVSSLSLASNQDECKKDDADPSKVRRQGSGASMGTQERRVANLGNDEDQDSDETEHYI